MTEKRRVPLLIGIVAWVFILLGLAFTAESCIRAVNEEEGFDIGAVFAILVGRGLLKLDRTWRKFALVYIWVGLSVSLIMLVLIPFGIDPDLRILSGIFRDAPAVLIAAFLLFVVVCYFAAYRILTTPKARYSFGMIDSDEKDSA